MKRWTRWQDWVALVAGVYAFLSPIWTPTAAVATGTLVLLGIVTALGALASLAEPDDVILQWLMAALGVVLFISPWVMGFVGTTGMAWTAWIVGAVTVIAGVWAVPASTKVHSTLVAQH
jgi:SPW repeat